MASSARTAAPREQVWVVELRPGGHQGCCALYAGTGATAVRATRRAEALLWSRAVRPRGPYAWRNAPVTRVAANKCGRNGAKTYNSNARVDVRCPSCPPGYVLGATSPSAQLSTGRRAGATDEESGELKKLDKTPRGSQGLAGALASAAAATARYSATEPDAYSAARRGAVWCRI
jgi:hypothetical protein